MDVEHLLDLVAVHGMQRVQPLLWQLSPDARAEFFDLLTLSRRGYSRYVEPADEHATPPTRHRAPKRRSSWFGETVYTTTYSDRAGAVQKGRELQQQYTSIEIVENKGQWEVHYDDAVPTTKAPFTDTRTFATKDEAINRARVLRAYGFAVRVRSDGAGRFVGIVDTRSATPALPTSVGIDGTFTAFDPADTRSHALTQVGFTTKVNTVSASKFQVEITALPDYTTTVSSSGTTLYTVQAKDTLYGISTRFGITVDELKKANGLTTDAISAGDVLKIPTKATAAKATTATTAAKPTTTAAKPTTAPPPSIAPPSPSWTAPIVTPPIASSTFGHAPGGDWAGGTLREDSFLRKADHTTIQTSSGGARLEFLKSAAVTLNSSSGEFVNVTGAAFEATKPPKAAGAGTGWLERDFTTMSIGVFEDIPVDDRTATYGALGKTGFFAAGAVKKIILHQTEGSTLASALSTFKDHVKAGGTVGSHYVIDETGAVILTVPITKIVSHATGVNKESIGVEHVGPAVMLRVPSSAKDTATLTANRTTIAGMTMSPKFQAGLLALSDRDLRQLASDNEARDRTGKRLGVWGVFGDISAVEKRASWVLVQKLITHFGLSASDVFAHEKVAPKSPGEGENIKEFHLARAAYPGNVTKLASLVAANSALLADPTMAKVVSAENAAIAALALDATPAENTAVTSKNAAALSRQTMRDTFYAHFWARVAQLDAFLAAAPKSTVPALLALAGAWQL